MESLGVFALCYIGGMSCVNPGQTGDGGVALAHMLALGILIYVGAATSGSNFNPAVTLALLFTKQGDMKCIRAIFYCLFQFLGGFFGAFLIWGVHAGRGPSDVKSKYCGTYPSIPELNAGIYKRIGDGESGGQYGARILQACFAEFFATFFLVFMVFATAVDSVNKTDAYGFCIAGAVGMSALGIGSLTGGAMNPMRWLGPWIVGFWGCHHGAQSGWGWLIYGVSTCAGGVTAGILYNWVFMLTPKKNAI